MTDILAALAGRLSPGSLLTASAIGERHRSDMSQTGESLPLAVVRPADTAAVATALATCNDLGVGVVPQGGLTGLAGGANPRPADIALSLERLTGIEAIDTDEAVMVVRAGTVLEVAQQAAASRGLMLPFDLGARGSCQIGGNLSTNAGGIRVIRHGLARDAVLGLEAVLADGTVLTSMNRMTKNNTGYDLKQLFVGAEGTLGVITRAVLRLVPQPERRETALVALPSFAAVAALLGRARAALSGLSAFEVMWRRYMAFNQEAEGLKLFATVPAFSVIVETEGPAAGAERQALETLLGTALEEGLVEDALLASSEREARAFWSVRDGYAMDRLLMLMNFDVSLPVAAMEAFAEAVDTAITKRWPQAHVSFFGHVGDGNLHIAIATGDLSPETLHAVDGIVYATTRQFSGSISAEHGIGLLKRDFLGYSRSETEIATMRRIKAALDPRGIMNPGKVLPP